MSIGLRRGDLAGLLRPFGPALDRVGFDLLGLVDLDCEVDCLDEGIGWEGVGLGLGLGLGLPESGRTEAEAAVEKAAA